MGKKPQFITVQWYWIYSILVVPIPEGEWLVLLETFSRLIKIFFGNVDLHNINKQSRFLIA